MMGKGEKAKFGFPLMHMTLLSVIALGIIGVVAFNSPSDSDEEQGTVIPLTSDSKRIVSPTIAKIDQVQQALGNDESFSLPPIPVGARLLPPTSTAPTSAPTETAIVAAPIALLKAITSKEDPKSDSKNASVDRDVTSVEPIVPAPASITATLSTQNTVPENVQTTIEEQDKFNKTAWLLGQNPNRYSLQLLGAYTLSAVQEFIREQGSLEDFAYFKTTHNSRDWYVVVYGLYRNRGGAIAAIEELPKDLQALTPWARSVRGIQQDIRKIQ